MGVYRGLAAVLSVMRMHHSEGLTVRCGAPFFSQGGVSKGGKQWILKKKDQMRAKGYIGIPQDSKHTGRKRKTRF
jgi:hypothetical protein